MNKEKPSIDLDAIVIEHFRLGMSRCYGRLLWIFIGERALALGRSVRSIGTQGGFDSSIAFEGQKSGNMSFPVLIAAMITLKLRIDELPPLPTHDKLRIAGYIQALECVRHRILRMTPDASLHPNDFECLRRSFAEGISKITDVAKKEQCAWGILKGVYSELPDAVSSPASALRYVDALHATWARSFNRCRAIIKIRIGWADEQ